MEFNPFSMVLGFADLANSQQRLGLAKQAAAMDQEQWDLNKQILQDQVANLSQDRQNANLAFLDERLANGGDPTDTLQAMGYKTPMYIFENPRLQMSPKDNQMFNYSQGVADAVAGKNAMELKRLDTWKESMQPRPKQVNPLDEQYKQLQIQNLQGIINSRNNPATKGLTPAQKISILNAKLNNGVIITEEEYNAEIQKLWGGGNMIADAVSGNPGSVPQQVPVNQPTSSGPSITQRIKDTFNPGTPPAGYQDFRSQFLYGQ